jgi:outer membrane lipoprotein-sorting protein
MRNTSLWARLLTSASLALIAAAPLAARADDPSETLLKQASAATAKLQSLKANVDISMGSHRATGTVEMKRPNLARVDLNGGNVQTIVADGTNIYTFAPSRKQFARQADTPDGKSVYLPWGIDLSFFHPEAIAARPPNTVITYLGKQKVNGEEYEVVQRAASKPYSLTTQYFISPRDHLIHRVVMTVKGSGQGQTVTSTTQIANLQPNAPLEAAAFRWTPPANATLYQPPAAGAAGTPGATGATGFQPSGRGATPPRR